MKKYLALLLALVMVLSLCACGAKTEEPAPAEETKTEETKTEETKTEETKTEETKTEETQEPAAEVLSADEVEDNMTSADGKYEVAFVTDVGQLKDKSFNQGTWDGVKLFAAQNGLSYKYYQPANGDAATDDDRFDAMKAACEAGAKVVVCAGFMQGTALTSAAEAYPDVKFVFIDGWDVGLSNVLGVAFNEHECGYFAGYAVVKEGYEKLGFCGGGGGTNPAVCRYGYGFVQGANAAAAEMGKTVDVNYTWLYGAAFAASPELQTLCNGWYENGTEVIFSCGGSIFQSITAAASANDGAVIGVDTDQSYESETVILSALKGIGEAAAWACAKVYDGTFEAGAVSLGAADGATGLPVATWSLENYTVEEYEAQLADVVSGALVIDSTVMENGAVADLDFSNLSINYVA